MRTLKKYNFIGMLLFMACIAGCNDDFVSTQPLGEVAEDAVWSDAALAEAFVIEIYNGFGQGGLDEQMQASLTDESMFTHPGRGINTVTESRSNDADQGWINGSYGWGNLYGRIRATNIALDRLAEPKFENANGIAEQLVGEAHFLRAFYYHQLLRYYGAVPIIDRAYELGEADYTAPRNTYEECVAFIVADCDRAAELLTDAPLVDGRASAVAALALKSRMLTYAASDLHDISTASANSSVISGYPNQEFLGYTSGDQQGRWVLARDASKAVLDAHGP